MPAGNACWQCLLAMPAGDACWRCLLEKPAGDACCAAAPGAAAQICATAPHNTKQSIIDARGAVAQICATIPGPEESRNSATAPALTMPALIPGTCLGSTQGALGYEPNTLTTAPLLLSTMVAGNAFWQCLLAIPAGTACWQCLLAMPAGNACWQCLLAMPAGDACWRCLLETPVARPLPGRSRKSARPPPPQHKTLHN